MDSWKDLPNIDIYMDQLIEVLETQLRPLAIPAEELSLTSNMVNNYVKLRLISPPLRKRYSRTQLSHLLIISLLKQVLTMAEVKKLLDALTSDLEQNSEELHDFFRIRLDIALSSDESVHKNEAKTEVFASYSSSQKALIATLNSLAAKTTARQLIVNLTETNPPN